ncbi:MAG: trigger factor [Gammaproteobacteria bacterium]
MQTVEKVDETETEALNVSVESGQGLERRLKVSVPAIRITREIETRLRSVGRSAQIKGYRPGKVPEKVIRQRFGSQVREEVLQDILRSTYNEALSRQEFRPAGEAQIDMAPQDETSGGDFAYTATFEIFPEVKLQGLEGLTGTRPEPAFDDEDVKYVIDNLRKQRGHWHATDREARDGDRLIVDFQGQLNGAPIEGGTGEKVTIVLGSGRMVEGFEKQLVGVKAGESRDLDVTFPGDYPNALLSGQTVQFAVQVSEVGEEHLPDVDAEFIRGFGVESGIEDDFHQDVRKNMGDEFAARARADIKRQLLEQLLAANPIEIPVILVEQEATSLQADAMRNLGITDTASAPSLESFRQTAERRVRLGLLIGALIREQNIVADRDRISQRIDQMSSSYDNPDEIRKLYFQTPQLLTQVENSVLEEQVVDWLAEHATITPKPMAFRALASD